MPRPQRGRARMLPGGPRTRSGRGPARGLHRSRPKRCPSAARCSDRAERRRATRSRARARAPPRRRAAEAMVAEGSRARLARSRLEPFRPAPETEAVAGEENRDTVIARRQEDAEHLLAGKQFPAKPPPLVRRRRPADVELVDAHEIGSLG